MVQSIPDAEEAARRLTEEALRKGSADNITCIVVRFHNDTINPSQPTNVDHLGLQGDGESQILISTEEC